MDKLETLRRKVSILEKKANKVGIVQINFSHNRFKKKEEIDNLTNIEEELDAIEYGLDYIEKSLK